jgi:glycosyltransferase involved in cell wall biosynthesis
VLNLALAQKKYQGLDVEIVTCIPGLKHKFSAELEGIRVHYLPASFLMRLSGIPYIDVYKISVYIRSLRPDIVHAHGAEWVYALAAQGCGFPYVITAQGAFFLINKIIKHSLFSRSNIIELFENRCLLSAKYLIAKSDYIRNALMIRYPHLKVYEIPNTFDEKILSIKENRQPKTVIFVAANIDKRKGLDVLRNSIEKVKNQLFDIHLVVVGNRKTTITDYENEEIKALYNILGERLILCGSLSALEVARQIAKATVLVAPSREEMFGNQVIESLLVGTPVIVTDNTGMAENVRRFGNGRIVPQENPSVLAEEILNACQPLACDVRKIARDKIIDFMHPQKVATEHRKVYEQIISAYQN